MQVQQEFSITATHHDRCVVLVVRGDLDELTAGSLDEELEAIGDGQPVVVDLGGHVHLLGEHPRTHQEPPARATGSGRARRALTRVLRIVQANRTNPMFLDRETALQSLSLTQPAAEGRR